MLFNDLLVNIQKEKIENTLAKIEWHYLFKNGLLIINKGSKDDCILFKKKLQVNFKKLLFIESNY